MVGRPRDDPKDETSTHDGCQHRLGQHRPPAEGRRPTGPTTRLPRHRWGADRDHPGRCAARTAADRRDRPGSAHDQRIRTEQHRLGVQRRRARPRGGFTRDHRRSGAGRSGQGRFAGRCPWRGLGRGAAGGDGLPQTQLGGRAEHQRSDPPDREHCCVPRVADCGPAADPPAPDHHRSAAPGRPGPGRVLAGGTVAGLVHPAARRACAVPGDRDTVVAGDPTGSGGARPGDLRGTCRHRTGSVGPAGNQAGRHRTGRHHTGRHHTGRRGSPTATTPSRSHQPASPAPTGPAG